MALLFDCVVVIEVPLELDLDIDASREIKTHQGINSLRCWINDVDQSLVGTHFEMFAAVLVLVRRADHAEGVLLRG